MKIFGQHDLKTIEQFHDVASRAVDAALMADGHVGYVMPIGGVAAYREQVSVVGVGFDIACLAAGTRVTTADGYHLPIESVASTARALCFDEGRVRPIEPHFGHAARGVRATTALTLANGRRVLVTGDHRIRTQAGWREVSTLRVGDRVACIPHRGLPHAPIAGELDLRDLRDEHRRTLEARGLWPVRLESAVMPALLRLLGYVNGDGHLTSDGKRISIYTTDADDAADLVRDWEIVGFRARVYRRARGENRRDEFHVALDSTALHAFFRALGAPVGRKAWAIDPMPWLLELPAWMRAQYVSAFASAEMMTPRVHASGTVPNLQLKQAGRDDHAIRFVQRLFESLDYEVSVAPSGAPYGDRRVHMLQLLGGEAAQVRYLDEIGFCLARAKRVASATVASIVWEHASYVTRRTDARDAARAMHASGTSYRRIIDDVASRFDVTQGFVYHAIYDRRGTPRRVPGEAVESHCHEESCWVSIGSIGDGHTMPVFDLVTGDPAQSFLADGVVVHNCGNCAIRTDLTLDHLANLSASEAEHDPRAVLESRPVRALADEIQRTISFGVGRANRDEDAPTEHPLFLDDAWTLVPDANGYRDQLWEKARAQLGTVGSGNHYVDVFYDDAGRIWVGVHFGSRGLGHTIASAFLAISQGLGWGERAKEAEVLLDVREGAGHDYWHLMELAGRYAYAGREWVARRVVELLGGREVEMVHNHHNFAWRETHGDEELLVVRKGATPAFPGQKGFVGGSMGDDAVIIRGTPDADEETAAAQRASLYSTVHGAGRVMSRTEAAGKKKGWGKKARVVKPGRVSPEMLEEWVARKGVVLRGGGLDESPHAYRRLPSVLAAQGSTVEVLETLHPLIVVMAGENEFDPYKD